MARRQPTGIFPASCSIDLWDRFVLRGYIEDDLRAIAVKPAYAEMTYEGETIAERIERWQQEIKAINERLKPYMRRRMIEGGKV